MVICSVGYHSVYGSDYRMRREMEKERYLLVLTRSRAEFRFGDRIYKAPENTAVLYCGGSVCEYAADGGIFVCDWLCFDVGGDHEFIESLELETERPLRFLDADFISELIRNIESEFYSINSRRAKLIDALIKTLLMKLGETGVQRNEAQMSAEPHYSLLIDLRAKIYRNPQLKWNVDSMAADVNMSRSYFQHIYREFFGVSCISDVISGKIEKAKEILSETSCTVSQVASMCGYDNEEHFMRQFKKLVGVTPTAYRKKR